MQSKLITISALLVSVIAALGISTANAEAYRAIGAKAPTDTKAKLITFVACRPDGIVGKYKGPRKDVGTATYVAPLTVKAAKKLIKPAVVTKRSQRLDIMKRALVKGKIPFSTSKNISSLNSEIDSCNTATPVPTQVANGTGTWLDEARSTTGQVNLGVTVDQSERKLTLQVGVTGAPLGIVDASNIPPETHEVSVPPGKLTAPFSFDSAFFPGGVAGNVTIDEKTGMFSASGTVTHGAGAGGFANTTASFNASGPVSGANVGAIDISGNFPAGNNNFTISTNPSN